MTKMSAKKTKNHTFVFFSIFLVGISRIEKMTKTGFSVSHGAAGDKLYFITIVVFSER